MSTKHSPETVVLQMAGLRQTCTITVPENVAIKIKNIKDAILKQETPSHHGGHSGHSTHHSPIQGWRKGGGGHSNNHTQAVPQGQQRMQLKSDWRSGSVASSLNAFPKSTSSNSFATISPTSTPVAQAQQNQQGHQGNQNSIASRNGHQRYVSRFRDTETPVDETILNTVILNKLNKFSEQNFEDVKQFLKQILDSEDTSFLKQFMTLVFRKAASEQTFCPLYARLICELSSQYRSLQKEFEALYKDYLTIFEDIDESKCSDYETFVKRNREKIYRLGYSQFLAELITRGVLQSDNLIMLFSKILEQVSNVSRLSKEKAPVIDEYIQCILRMTRALKNTDLLQNINCFEEPIEYLIQGQGTEFPGLTKKSQFALMDCLDVLRGTSGTSVASKL